MAVSQMEKGTSGLPKYARLCEATLSGGGSRTLLEPTMIPAGNGIPFWRPCRNRGVYHKIIHLGHKCAVNPPDNRDETPLPCTLKLNQT